MDHPEGSEWFRNPNTVGIEHGALMWKDREGNLQYVFRLQKKVWIGIARVKAQHKRFPAELVKDVLYAEHNLHADDMSPQAAHTVLQLGLFNELKE